MENALLILFGLIVGFILGRESVYDNRKFNNDENDDDNVDGGALI